MVYENSALQWLYSNAWCIVASIYHAACTLRIQVALSTLSENAAIYIGIQQARFYQFLY